MLTSITSKDEYFNQEIKPATYTYLVEVSQKKDVIPDYKIKEGFSIEELNKNNGVTTLKITAPIGELPILPDIVVKPKDTDYIEKIESDWSTGFKLVVSNPKKTPFKLELIDAVVRASYEVRKREGVYSFKNDQEAVFIIDRNEPSNNISYTIVPQYGDSNPSPTPADPAPIAKDPEPAATATNKEEEKGEVVLFTDFSKHEVGTAYTPEAQRKDNIKVNFSGQGMKLYSAVDKKDGKSALKITYPAKPQNGWDLHRQFAALLPDAPEYFVSYKMYFSENFIFKGNDPKLVGGKLPGLAQIGDTPKGKKLCSGGQVCHGKNGFTMRMMWRSLEKPPQKSDNARLVLYAYDMDKKVGKNGKSFGRNIDLKSPIKRGQWIEVKQRVKCNTGNNNNAEVEMWIDGKQVLDIDNYKLVTNGRGVDCFYFSTFHGGAGHKWRPSQDCYAWFTDLKVWRPA